MEGVPGRCGRRRGARRGQARGRAMTDGGRGEEIAGWRRSQGRGSTTMSCVGHAPGPEESSGPSSEPTRATARGRMAGGGDSRPPKRRLQTARRGSFHGPGDSPGPVDLAPTVTGPANRRSRSRSTSLRTLTVPVSHRHRSLPSRTLGATGVLSEGHTATVRRVHDRVKGRPSRGKSNARRRKTMQGIRRKSSLGAMPRGYGSLHGPGASGLRRQVTAAWVRPPARL